jgi:hypothetical protein
VTSFRQIEANWRNAFRSTGPNTEDGKRRSRQNAVRHGLSAEIVVEILETHSIASIGFRFCPNLLLPRSYGK